MGGIRSMALGLLRDKGCFSCLPASAHQEPKIM